MTLMGHRKSLMLISVFYDVAYILMTCFGVTSELSRLCVVQGPLGAKMYIWKI